MSRASRLLDLLQLLRNRRVPVTGPVLADELGVSIRTLYRDIGTLQAQGADIRGEPGLGYVLMPGFTLPPLMFSADEIEALALGSRWVAAQASDDRLGDAAKAAIAKIGAVLPPEMGDVLEAGSLLVFGGERIPATADLSVVRLAIRSQKKLAIRYNQPAAGETERTIWPFAIGFFDKVRCIVGWCELRNDFRTFRLDRITTLDALEQRYPGNRNALLKAWRAQDEHNRPRPTAGN
jgi:predicted DNA-binding transcriptional regulator YafY